MTPTETLVHIVPAVPPAFNGLADYSFKLWEHWPQPRPAWKCLSAQVPPGATELWPQVQVVPFELSGRGLLQGLERAAPNCVVLHYVGYAYHKKGVPLWLPAALRGWKRASGGRLCVMFHELYALGTPRQSAFWLQPWTKSIVVQLSELADAWVTSNEDAAARLVHRVGIDRQRGNFVPVGSNIEPATPIDFERAWPLDRNEKIRIAIFGLPRTRMGALSEHQNLLKLLVERDLVSAISLIGKSEAAPSDALRALQALIAPANPAIWQEYADLAPVQLSDVLKGHHLSLSRNRPQLLTKSGSYAAACVHGLPTVCQPSAPDALPLSGLNQGSHEQVPHLINDDNHAAKAFDALCDAQAIRKLRAEVEYAALHDLSWSSIVRKWNEIVAPERAQ